MIEKGAPVWFITGCSSGFGQEIARQVLEAGGRAAITARQPETLKALAAVHGERALAMPLDVSRPEQITQAVNLAEASFGRIDVLCNNAGISYLTSVEEGEDARIRALFETNFFGPLNVMKAVLPGMRARRGGRIINFSSIGGLAAFAASGYYAASKFALEGLSEALAQEVAALGIKLTLIEPGPFRTGMAQRAEHGVGRDPDYEGTVHARRDGFRKAAEEFPGDPVRGAAAVLRVAEMAEPPLRLLLGAAAYVVATQRFQSVLAEFERFKDVALGTDFPATGDYTALVKGG